MNKLYLNTIFIAIWLSVYLSGVVAENDDPIVFVHGYAGSSDHFQYGPELSEAGLLSFAVDVNPEASNHIRACEIYAQLKGLQTDYGVCYSQEFNIERYGPDYTGKAMYPDWNENNQLHFIGHSQGGLTVRYLERMLEQGSDCPEDTFEFFTGGKRWITSLTAMATPQEGSSVYDPDFGPFPGYHVPKALLNLQVPIEKLDFSYAKLVREPLESFQDFYRRVEDSGILGSEISGIFDMSTQGSLKFSMEDDPSPYSDRYYFGIATERTNPIYDCYFYGLIYVCDDVELPDPLMNEFYYETAEFIGRYSPPEDRENDGIVSNSRARCPRYTECDEVRDGSTDWYPGKWQYIDLDFLDHLQLTFRNEENDEKNFENSAKRIWLEHGLRLKLIPSKSTPRDEAYRFNTSEKAAEVQRYLEAHRFFQNLKLNETKEGMSFGGFVALQLFILLIVCSLGVLLYKRVRSHKKKEENGVEHYAATL